jgi:hypothetical protein
VSVRTLEDIRTELERAIARRSELWHELATGVDPAKSAEAAKLSKLIDDLWAEDRAVRARTRWGDADLIRARARAEERLEREARRVQRRAA